MDDVERIAEQLYYAYLHAPHPGWDVLSAAPWRLLDDDERETWRSMVTELLHKDTIRVGSRPSVERPLAGQTQIGDFLDG